MNSNSGHVLVDRNIFLIRRPAHESALRGSCYGFLAGALSCFFCSSCFCFVNCCCLFLSLSFLPPLSPMPAPFQRLRLEVWITARLIIRNRREPTLPQLQ